MRIQIVDDEKNIRRTMTLALEFMAHVVALPPRMKFAAAAMVMLQFPP